MIADFIIVRCEDCHGSGREYRPAPQRDDPYFERDIGPCPSCGGTGQLDVPAEDPSEEESFER